MALSNDLLSQFAKISKPAAEDRKETTVYGTLMRRDGTPYVKIDGSDILTPVYSTVGADDGDRVTVLIKNHSAIVTGNISNPAASGGQVGEIGDKISEFEIVIADKVDTKELAAQAARIDDLTAKHVTITGDLEAAKASIDELEAKQVTITGELTAAKADIDELETKKLDAEVADIKYADIEDLEAVNADIHNLDADYGNFKDLTTDKFKAADAEIKRLDAEKISVDDLDAKYANIDFANIGKAAIENFFSKSGMIGDLVIGDGTITGTLVGVTIKGDLIEGGTVVADKLVIKGTDGLYYKLNTDGETVSSQQTEYNSLNGQIITAKTVTAEKISVKDLVAFGATIGGFKITDSSLYSGVKESAANTTRGVFLGDDGQFAVGDGSNFLKYFKDKDGTYKLDISAAAIKIGAASKDIEEVIADNVKDEVGNITIGATNLLADTKTMLSKVSKSEDITIKIDDEGFGVAEYPASSSDVWYVIYFNRPGYLGNTPLLLLSSVMDKTITVSFEAKSNNPNSNPLYIGFNVHDEKGTRVKYQTETPRKPTLTKDWQKITQTVTITEAYFTQGKDEFPKEAYFGVSIHTRTIYNPSVDIRKVKMEIGTMATDWSPSPYDDSAEVGGRNIATGTAALMIGTGKRAAGHWRKSASASGDGSIKNIDIVNSPVNGIKKGIRIVSSNNNGTTWYGFAQDRCIIEKNQEYTMSFWLKGSIPGINIMFRPWWNDSEKSSDSYVKTTGEWQYVKMTSSRVISETKEVASIAYVYIWKNGLEIPNGSYVDVCGIKVERGNKATEWTPAPEDQVITELGGTNLQKGSKDWAKSAFMYPNMGTPYEDLLIDNGVITCPIGFTGIETHFISTEKDQLNTVSYEAKFSDEFVNILTGSKDMVIGTGGRSKGHWAWSNKTNGTGTVIDIPDTPFSISDNVTNGFRLKGVRLTQKALTAHSAYAVQQQVPIAKGEYYTISAWIKGSVSGITAGLNPFNGAKIKTFKITNQWVNYTYTVHNENIAEGNINAGYVFIASGNTIEGASIDVCGIKLEKGESASRWTAAPEDFTGKTEDVATAIIEHFNSANKRVWENGFCMDKVTSEWKRFTHTVMTMTTDAVNMRLGLRSSGVIGISYRRLKVERGNIATDWSISPYDTPIMSGVNLIQDSTGDLGVGWPSSAISDDGVDGYCAIEVSRTGATTANGRYSVRNRNIDIPNFKSGDEYTLSGWIKVHSDINLDDPTRSGAFVRFIYSIEKDSGVDLPIYLSKNTEKNKWLYFKNTMAINTTKPVEGFEVFVVVGRNGHISASKLQLEKGNVATEWSQSPKDLANTVEVGNAQNAANSAQGAADEAISRVESAEAELEILSDSISSMVTDANGNSLMTQTSDGWTFNISSIQNSISDAQNKVTEASKNIADLDKLVDNLDSLTKDLSKKTAYIVMTTDDSGAPCIELGKEGNPFKVRITNTSVDFMEKTSKIAYISNQRLYIETAVVKNELQIGEGTGYVWKKRSNGNMGLRWIE